MREIVLRNAPAEERAGELFSAPRHSHREVLEGIADAASEERVKGVFLRVGALGGAFARVSELREALLALRAAKKTLHCYFDATDNSGYGLLAEVCERISMSPNALLAFTGLRTESYYVRDLLEQVGVTAELLQVGRYKGAADTLTRSEMSPELRETLSALLDDLSADLTRGVMVGRSLEPAAVTKAIDEGPHTARSALALRLIDAIAFDDEARSRAKAAAKAERVVRVLERPDDRHVGIGEILDLLFEDDEKQARGERLVLAYVDGEIGDGESEGADGVQSGPFVKAMRRYADDKNVRAVVLRVDSPGGSALASDKMWHAVRRVAKRKPVIVSIGDMAASGGYYVACAGTEIFASPTSIVGSIGVVGGKIVGESLASKIGVHRTALVRGRNANWMSPLSRFSDSERSALQRTLEETYKVFLSRVREGRNLSDSQLQQVAEGRIMSGQRAEQGGLVDRSGGLRAALAHARKKTGLRDEAPTEIWPEERSIFTRLSNAMAENEARSPFDSLASVPFASRLAGSVLVQALLRADSAPLAVLPFELELR